MTPREEEIAREAFLKGYRLGHDDTVEGNYLWCAQGEQERWEDTALDELRGEFTEPTP